jgi:hypothetical protein
MIYGADRMKCPACGGIAESDSVDVGVGLIVRGNFSCECGWEIHSPNDFGFLDLDERPFAPPEVP